jgi:hypothetical protein
LLQVQRCHITAVIIMLLLALEFVIFFVEKLHHGICIFIKPRNIAAFFTSYNLLAQGIDGFHKTIVTGVNIIAVAFVTMIFMRLLAMSDRVAYFRFICKADRAETQGSNNEQTVV